MAASSLAHILTAYGYWAVLVMVMVESLGIPVPGESTLILAAVYAGTRHELRIELVIGAAMVGAVAGDNIGFLLGREGGFRLATRFGHYLRLDDRKLKLGQYLFLKHGAKLVFWGRFVAFLRAWSAFLAGTNRMPWPRFLLANGAGGMLWASAYGVLGYVVGSQIGNITGKLSVLFGAVAVAAMVAGGLFLRKNEHRLEDEAARALPGPLRARTIR
ncbi:MAG TPA: DedA family protein [Chloroflexota bacterium]|nr:DedA family protein [Chloroflexota bacterium]